MSESRAKIHGTVHNFEASEYRVKFTASNVLFRVVFKVLLALSLQIAILYAL